MDKKIKLLCSAADREALAPVIAQLKEKGLHVSELGSGADGKDVVLAVLSEGFFADGSLKERLLGLIGAGAENVLPLHLDDAAIPSEIKNALYARNIIPAAGRGSWPRCRKRKAACRSSWPRPACCCSPSSDC